MTLKSYSPARTLLVTQSDNFYLPRYVDGVLSSKGTGITAILVLPSFPNIMSMLKNMLSLFGPILFIFLGAKYLSLIVLDSFLRATRLPSRFSVQSIARKHKVPCYAIKNINSSEGLSLIQHINPEVIFSLAAPQKFQRKLVSYPLLGCYNIHAALLPKYRGIYGVFWAMVHGEQTTGFTIHKMDLHIDTGPVAMQKKIYIHPKDSYDTVCKRMISSAIPEIVQFLRKLSQFRKNFPLKEISQDILRKSKYYSFPESIDRKQFKKLGKKFFKYL